MPGRDGTGPIGMGSMSGRGFGACAGGAAGYGAGLGRGGRGRGFCGYAFSDRNDPSMRKEMLSEQKKRLEDRLDFVNKQLDEL
jgi:hypothetical protein